MTHELLIGAGFDSSIVDLMTPQIEAIVAVFEETAQSLQTRMPRLEVWLEPELQSSLKILAPNAKGHPLDPNDLERMGAMVVGKAIPLADYWSEVAVVVSGNQMFSPDSGARVIGTFFLTHELAHALIETLGVQSGAREAKWTPHPSPRGKARNAIRRGIDEWRASMIANIVLNGALSDGAGEKVAISDLLGPTYRDNLLPLLDYVYPGWPDTVDAYRQDQMSLEDMWIKVCGETLTVFTYLGHCEAEAHSLGRLSPINDDVANHPGVRLLIGPLWNAVMNTDMPILPPLSEFAALEAKIIETGADEVMAMWKKLGLTFTESPPNSLTIHVSEPCRDIPNV